MLKSFLLKLISVIVFCHSNSNSNEDRNHYQGVNNYCDRLLVDRGGILSLG